MSQRVEKLKQQCLKCLCSLRLACMFAFPELWMGSQMLLGGLRNIVNIKNVRTSEDKFYENECQPAKFGCSFDYVHTVHLFLSEQNQKTKFFLHRPGKRRQVCWAVNSNRQFNRQFRSLLTSPSRSQGTESQPQYDHPTRWQLHFHPSRWTLLSLVDSCLTPSCYHPFWHDNCATHIAH